MRTANKVYVGSIERGSWKKHTVNLIYLISQLDSGLNTGIWNAALRLTLDVDMCLLCMCSVVTRDSIPYWYYVVGQKESDKLPKKTVTHKIEWYAVL